MRGIHPLMRPEDSRIAGAQDSADSARRARGAAARARGAAGGTDSDDPQPVNESVCRIQLFTPVCVGFTVPGTGIHDRRRQHSVSERGPLAPRIVGFAFPMVNPTHGSEQLNPTLTPTLPAESYTPRLYRLNPQSPAPQR